MNDGNGHLDHVTPVPGGPWVMWRSMVLRGAGFPARQVLRLAAPSCAAQAEELIHLEERFEAVRRGALEEVDRGLDELRASGEWQSSPRRKPLMKALRALSKGNIPRAETVNGSLASACEELEAVRAELEAARRSFVEVYEAETAKLSDEIEEVAGWDRFREAVTWQNRRARRTALDPLIGNGRSTKRNSQRRQHEEMVASYLQRYAVKNDTVGFFGPVGWARAAPIDEVVRMDCGSELLARREVYFENWCIDALARQIGGWPEMRPWLPPRLRSSVYIEDETLYPPFGAPLTLSPAQARLLTACDGETPARILADELIADPEVALASEEEVFALLERFSKKRILVWNLEVPLELHPERTLREHLVRIGDDDVRRRAVGALDELEEARAQVQSSAGDAERLDGALEALEATFTRLTGLASERHHGQTYAARGLVYEDCRRSSTLELGTGLIDRLGPPMTLVLQGARWMAGELSRRTEQTMLRIYRDLSRKSGSSSVRSHLWLSQVFSTLFYTRQRPDIFTEVEDEYQARWLRALALEEGGDPRPAIVYRADELRARVDEEFCDSAPTWLLTRYFGPDIMISADGEENLRRGNFQIALGEVHAGNCMGWSCFMSQHPDPEELRSNMALDLDVGFGLDSHSVVLPQLIKQTIAQRINLSLVLPRFYRYRLGEDPPDRESRRLLPAGAVLIEQSESGLIARTRDGSLEFPAIDLLGLYLWQEMNNILSSFLGSARHWPRITVDDVVMCREKWSFAVAELDFLSLNQPHERFVAVRRWARRHAIPRFCFYRVSTERKPCYLDLDSPVYVELFFRMLRSAAQEDGTVEKVSVSEMLPRVDQTWLSDASGQRYTCELRMVCYENDRR